VLSALVRGQGEAGKGAKSGIVLTDAAHVQGGRHFALVVRKDTFQPEGIAKALARANEAAARKLEVVLDHAARDALHHVEAQPFSDGVTHPGPETTLRVVRIGDASALPCDGTLRSTTAGLGRIVLQASRPDPLGVALQFRVEA
jgi:Ser-tRNA(Ala) deacylase AlaX